LIYLAEIYDRYTIERKIAATCHVFFPDAVYVGVGLCVSGLFAISSAEPYLNDPP
jgi:hypothetical protein